ncbi:MAG: protease pro-enzyme activation domain-containing protein [Paludisphaera borealis]|uniref:protease pro-enzyme activation domain-containing protein n=1 Tax=Paludisphaera borealis TaxID=1387353 RepID=UPI0028444C12|nr:protease pro-enzyme activation domain-containing protein [Paludisphaera borealis]MDR3622724.1 protease pro-enzyme activation domain-containing protein [Paludisphaera borealis]
MTTPIESHAIGPADPDKPMTVTVIVRPRRPAPSEAEIEAQAMTPIAERTYLARGAVADAHGADPVELEAVGAFARRHGLNVVESDAARRRVVLTGRAADCASAFGVTLHRFHGPTAEYCGTTDEVNVPTELQSIVECVLGLDDRPAAQPRGR